MSEVSEDNLRAQSRTPNCLFQACSPVELLLAPLGGAPCAGVQHAPETRIADTMLHTHLAFDTGCFARECTDPTTAAHVS